MGKVTGITWTDHTFNGVIGCTKVSPACTHCYAETASPVAVNRRHGLELWGPQAQRRSASEAMWQDLDRWDAVIRPGDHRRLVFCYSLGDVFEDNNSHMINHKGEHLYVDTVEYKLRRPNLKNWRQPREIIFTPTPSTEALVPVTHDVIRKRLFNRIEQYKGLIFLLLTKRPENVLKMVPLEWGTRWPDNAWIGTTAENQEYADERVQHLIQIPAPVRFLSVEPMLGPVSYREALHGGPMVIERNSDYRRYIQWVIVGGESRKDGKTRDARIMQLEWVQRLRDECQADGIPYFFKQWGDYIPFNQIPDGYEDASDMSHTCTRIGDNDYYCLGNDNNGDRLDGQQYRQFPADRYSVVTH